MAPNQRKKAEAWDWYNTIVLPLTSCHMTILRLSRHSFRDLVSESLCRPLRDFFYWHGQPALLIPSETLEGLEMGFSVPKIQRIARCPALMLCLQSCCRGPLLLMCLFSQNWLTSPSVLASFPWIWRRWWSCPCSRSLAQTEQLPELLACVKPVFCGQGGGGDCFQETQRAPAEEQPPWGVAVGVQALPQSQDCSAQGAVWHCCLSRQHSSCSLGAPGYVGSIWHHWWWRSAADAGSPVRCVQDATFLFIHEQGARWLPVSMND